MPDTMKKTTWSILAGVALAALLVAGSGCDEKEEVPEEDQRLFLSAIPSQTCPAITWNGARYELDESAPESEFELVATVFADDGQVQDGVEIVIESTNLDTPVSYTGETDESGQVRVTTPAPPRPPEFAEWLASAANGEQSEAETATGFFPFLSMTPVGDTTIECGEEFEVVISVSLGCLVSAIDAGFTLTGQDEDENPVDSVAFLGARRIGTLEVEEDSDDTSNANSTITPELPEGENPPAISLSGDFSVSYARIDDGYGATFDGGFFGLTFRALADDQCVPGNAILVFDDAGPALVTPAEAIGGVAGQYDLLSPPGGADPRLGPGILYTIVEAAAP